MIHNFIFLVFAFLYKTGLLNSKMFLNNEEAALLMVCMSFLLYIVDNKGDKTSQKNIVCGGDIAGGDLIK